jgi:hypothetical protein
MSTEMAASRGISVKIISNHDYHHTGRRTLEQLLLHLKRVLERQEYNNMNIGKTNSICSISTRTTWQMLRWIAFLGVQRHDYWWVKPLFHECSNTTIGQMNTAFPGVKQHVWLKLSYLLCSNETMSTGSLVRSFDFDFTVIFDFETRFVYLKNK